MAAYTLFALATLVVVLGLVMAHKARTGPQSTLASLLVAVGILLAFAGAAFARDDGRYANSALKPWFDGLRSGKGPCCSDADGYALAECRLAKRGRAVPRADPALERPGRQERHGLGRRA